MMMKPIAIFRKNIEKGIRFNYIGAQDKLSLSIAVSPDSYTGLTDMKILKCTALATCSSLCFYYSKLKQTAINGKASTEEFKIQKYPIQSSFVLIEYI